jgi:hypothetical protein
MKCDFELFDLKVDKIREAKEYYILFEEDCFHYRLHAKIDISTQDEEEEDRLENVLENVRRSYLRNQLVGLQMYNEKEEDGKTAHWTVTLLLNGMDEISIYFQKGPEAKVFYDTALAYLKGKLILDTPS